MAKRYAILKCTKCGKEIIKPSRTCDGIKCDCGDGMVIIKFTSHKGTK